MDLIHIQGLVQEYGVVWLKLYFIPIIFLKIFDNKYIYSLANFTQVH
jgi:hypothetical protein